MTRKAVIIAGGEGTRLRPLTFEMPKALLPFHGKPILDFAIDLFFQHDAHNIWFAIGGRHERQILDKYPGNPFWLDRDTQTHAIIRLDTGGWLNRLSQHEGQMASFNDDFFACNADNLVNFNLKEALKEHIAKKNVATLICVKVPDVREYGSVHIQDGKIKSFEEKKKSRIKKSGYINSGYYIFSPKIYKYVQTFKRDLNQPFSLEHELFPLLAKEGVLGAVKSDKQWFDTGTFDRWDKAYRDWDETERFS